MGRQGQAEIARAEAIDPMIADSHLASQLLLWSAYEGYQNEAAVRELLLAQKLDPNAGRPPLAVMYGHMGLMDLALRELEAARQVDPTSELVKNGFVLIWSLARIGRNGRRFAQLFLTPIAAITGPITAGISCQRDVSTRRSRPSTPSSRQSTGPPSLLNNRASSWR